MWLHMFGHVLSVGREAEGETGTALRDSDQRQERRRQGATTAEKATDV
jgi:hypothetical protein